MGQISTGTVWEVRPDGLNSNGGGFDAAFGGTDYSQQAAPQLTVTDFAHTVGTTTYTSATGGFTSAMVGNVFAFFDGSNWVPFTITAFTDTHTISASDYGGSFSSKTCHVGGSNTIDGIGIGFMQFLVPFSAFTGVKMWLRATNSNGSVNSYANTLQTNLTFGGTQTKPFTVEGYSTVRGDGGMPTYNMNGSNYLNIGVSYLILRNLHIVGANGWQCGVSLTGSSCVLENLLIEPNANSTANDFLDVSGTDNICRRIYLKASTKDVAVAINTGARNTFEHCDFGSVAASVNGVGFICNAMAEFYHCIFRDCSAQGFQGNLSGSASRFHNCTFWNNTGDNARLNVSNAGLMNYAFEDCIFGKAGAYDLNYTPADLSADLQSKEWSRCDLRGNWFFTTGTARYHQIPIADDDTSLTGDPFVSASTGNFALNPLSVPGLTIISNPRAIVLPDGSTSYIIAGAITPAIYTPATVVAAAVAGVAPSIDEVQFPPQISEGASGGPTFSTVVIVAGNGLEQRVPVYSHGRYQWNAGTGLKSPSDMALVTAFWLARQGRARGFRWKDWDDYIATTVSLTPTGQPTTQLIKAYTSGAVIYNRVIYKPVAGSVSIKRNGSPYAAWALDTTSGIITWTPIIQKSITAITAASSAVVTVGAAHGFVVGDVVYFASVTGMTQINTLTGTITATASTTITVNINSSTFTAYVSGGTATKYVQPADTVTWTGQFDVPVRFDTDVMVMNQQSSQIRSWDTLPIIELTG